MKPDPEIIDAEFEVIKPADTQLGDDPEPTLGGSVSYWISAVVMGGLAIWLKPHLDAWIDKLF
jgi:hypothetical protein